MLGVGVTGWAQECTHQWIYLLSTDPLAPKVIHGDTHAAYAIFSFQGDPTKRFVLKGRFPRARFVSLESNTTRWGLKVDALFDTQILTDSGERLEFDGLSLKEAPFTLHAIPQDEPVRAANTVRLPNNKLQHSLLYRVYAPTAGPVTENDIPRIFAYDVRTGEPAVCPKFRDVKLTLNLPQFLTLPVKRKIRFDLEPHSVPWGPNSAIPNYLAAANRTRPDDVTLIRMKVPTFGPHKEVRYWSLCAANLVKLVTLACVPDVQARVDSDGFVTVVYGRGESVRKQAEAMGYSFLPDTRPANQKVAEYAFRNILPDAQFAESVKNDPDYIPKGLLCSRASFLRGDCRY